MKSLSLKFYLNKKKPYNRKYKIFGRIIINRKKAEFYTGFSLKENEWNPETNKARKNIEVNQELAEIERKIYSIRRKIIDEGHDPTSKDIVDVLMERDNRFKDVYILDYYNQCLNDMKKRQELADNTIKHYEGTCSILGGFIKYSGKPGYNIKKIDYQFIKAFDDYMLVEHKSPLNKNIKRNTINKHHARFKAILNIARKDGLIAINPYENFKLKFEKTNRAYLTAEEVSLIEKADLGGNKSLEKVRDIFLFSCQIGYRFEDAMGLRMSDIKTREDGTKFLEVITGKTGERYPLPLTRKAKEIIEKYNDSDARAVYNLILPKMSNQKFNTYIKVITNLAGIEKNVTHHVARHTFATAALNRGIPLEVVQKILGHRNYKTTQIYAKIVDDTIFTQMKKMDV